MTKMEEAIKFIKELECQLSDYQFLLVGGAVRDIIMGKEPHDFDIATNCPLEEIEARYVADNIGASKEFGIINVHCRGEQYEVATFRTEGDYSDSRHPSTVTKAETFEDDSARRDFTINSLGYTSAGEIVDFHGGAADIANKRLRTVGNPLDRFTEDPLRIVRLFRFAATFDFEIDVDTALAARAIIGRGPLAVSVERVRDELYKAAKTGKSLRAFVELLDDFAVLDFYIPELVELQDKPQPPEWHPEGDAYVHTLCAVEASRSPDPIVNLAILFHDIGKGPTYQLRGDKHTFYGHDGLGPKIIEEIASRLKIGTADEKSFAFCAHRHMMLHKPKTLTRNKVVKMVNDPNWEVLREVGYADEMSRGLPEPEDQVPGTDYADEAKFVDNISYMIELTDEVNSGGGPEALKQRIKEMIDGRKLLKWHPELNEPDNRKAIGVVLKDVQEWIVNSNKFDSTEDDIKKVAKRRVRVALK